MKCRIVKQQMPCTDPNVNDDRVEVVMYQRTTRSVPRPKKCWKLGAIIEDPDSWRLVRMGVAEPADKKCEDKAGMSQEAMKAAQLAHERLKRGIHIADYGRFDSGEIEGYHAGEEIPGPNSPLPEWLE